MVRNTQSVVKVLGKNAAPEVRIGQFVGNILIDVDADVFDGIIRNSQSVVKILGSTDQPTVRVSQFSVNMLLENGLTFVSMDCDFDTLIGCVILDGEAGVIASAYAYACGGTGGGADPSCCCNILIDALPDNCADWAATYIYLTCNGIVLPDDLIEMGGTAEIFACYFYSSNNGCNVGPC